MEITPSDKFANTPVILTLCDGTAAEMRTLTIKQMAELDAYVRGRFMQNTLAACEGLPRDQADRVIQNMAIAAQKMVWTDETARTIFETEEFGMAYYSFKYIESGFTGGFNEWKSVFNADYMDNAKLFLAARYVLHYSADTVANSGSNSGSETDPDMIYKLLAQAINAGLTLSTALSLTPFQLNQYILSVHSENGVPPDPKKIHFRNREELEAWIKNKQNTQTI